MDFHPEIIAWAFGYNVVAMTVIRGGAHLRRKQIAKKARKDPAPLITVNGVEVDQERLQNDLQDFVNTGYENGYKNGWEAAELKYEKAKRFS